ncbi:unnamed protein product, partial [Musa textilis]
MAKSRSRASKLIKTKKVQPKLEAVFTCPFCNHDKSVSCTWIRRSRLGRRSAGSAKRATPPLSITLRSPSTYTASGSTNVRRSTSLKNSVTMITATLRKGVQ